MPRSAPAPRPRGFWTRVHYRLRRSDLPTMNRLEKAGRGLLIPGIGWVPAGHPLTTAT